MTSRLGTGMSLTFFYSAPYRTERERRDREVSEVAIIVVLADGEEGIGASSNDKKNLVVFIISCSSQKFHSLHIPGF